MWNDIAQLRLLGMWLQWLAIGLVFFGGFLQVAKFFVDRREKALVSIEQAERQKPSSQLITSGSATVEIVVASADTTNSHFMDRGGYLAFGQGSNAMMTFSSIDCFGIQNGKNEVAWRSVLSLDARDPAIGKKLAFLRDAEFIQIAFGPLPPQSMVKGGLAVITINGVIRLKIDIPAQKMDADLVLVRDLATLQKELE